MDETAFVLRTAGDIPRYSCIALEQIPGLQHGFSIRRSDAGAQPSESFNLGYTAWDSDDRVDQNRRLFLSSINLSDARLATLRQIHSCRIHIIKEVPDKWNPLSGDGLLTAMRGAALAVQTADCVPVLIADPRSGAIAAIHSGWRGTLQEIAFHSVRLMQSSFGGNPADFLVALGPCIRSCCYEVGKEVYDPFLRNHARIQKSTTKQGKYFLDLPGIIEAQLRKAGAGRNHIYDLGLCTCCNTDTFFSYRAEGEDSGRLMAVIGFET